MKKIPTWWANSIYKIDYDVLKEEGKEVLLFDLDNTITSPFNKYPSEKEKEFLENLKKDFKVLIISNNRKTRVDRYCKDLDIDHLARAFKPLTKKAKKFLEGKTDDYNKVVFIGDQIFTDIKFANKMGIDSILLEILSEDEQFHIKIKRILERIIKRKKKTGVINSRKGEINVK